MSIILDDGEYAVLSRGGYCIRGIVGGEVKRKRLVEIDWNLETAEIGGDLWPHPLGGCRGWTDLVEWLGSWMER
jgi:hypothetical protein